MNTTTKTHTQEYLVHALDKVFVTSDTHFGHKNIIEYCARPFLNTHDMNMEMIYRWNKTVPVDGVVYHLGDFAFGSWEKYLPHLNGTILFVRGNHDHTKYYKNTELNVNISDSLELTLSPTLSPTVSPTLSPKKVFMSHYPMFLSEELTAKAAVSGQNAAQITDSAPQNAKIYRPDAYEIRKYQECDLFLFGHTHNNDSVENLPPKCVNMCVENWDYTPVSLENILKMKGLLMNTEYLKLLQEVKEKENKKKEIKVRDLEKEIEYHKRELEKIIKNLTQNG